MSATSHLEAARSYIAVAESSDAKREAYTKAADEILAAQAEDSNLSNVKVGREVGKTEKWVRELLWWRKEGSDARPTPFARDDWEHRRESLQKQVPTSHKARVEMATKLLADPKVAKTVAPIVTDPKTKAGRLISQHVHDQDAAQRRERLERAEQIRVDKALPLPAYMADMVVKINEWSLGLAALVDDLDELPEGHGRELVADAIDGLIVQAGRWRDRLERKPNLRVIEGQAKSVG